MEVVSPSDPQKKAFQVPPLPCSDGSVRVSGGNHSTARPWEADGRVGNV